eukprot:111758-Chlamydomonas_euryale.AAC.10
MEGDAKHGAAELEVPHTAHCARAQPRQHSQTRLHTQQHTFRCMPRQRWLACALHMCPPGMGTHLPPCGRRSLPPHHPRPTPGSTSAGEGASTLPLRQRTLSMTEACRWGRARRRGMRSAAGAACTCSRRQQGGVVRRHGELHAAGLTKCSGLAAGVEQVNMAC